MTQQSIIDLIRAAIADEERLDYDFHRGRVSALRHVLEMLTEDEQRGEKFLKKGKRRNVENKNAMVYDKSR